MGKKDDNILNTPGLMDPSTEFGNMMQTAMKMKSAQMDQDRRRFETWPQFLQNSMWERNEKTLALRELPPASRLDGAAALKEEGNEFFRNKKYTSAVEAYEAAVGSFVYAKQLDPDWKKKGIKDETIDLIDERGTGEDKERVDAFLVAVQRWPGALSPHGLAGVWSQAFHARRTKTAAPPRRRKMQRS